MCMKSHCIASRQRWLAEGQCHLHEGSIHLLCRASDGFAFEELTCQAMCDPEDPLGSPAEVYIVLRFTS